MQVPRIPPGKPLAAELLKVGVRVALPLWQVEFRQVVLAELELHIAHSNDIPVGPGRGSAAGSMVAYCLAITEVDPMKYGLFFERFLNPAGYSL